MVITKVSLIICLKNVVELRMPTLRPTRASPENSIQKMVSLSNESFQKPTVANSQTLNPVQQTGIEYNITSFQ
jgi:hypothetical protein